nr:hypothetical protein CFP56_43181 [Quercus suber]
MQELINLVGQSAKRLELFGVVAWFIWNQRNKLRLNEKEVPSDKLFEAARIYLSDFQSKIQETKVQQPKEIIKWIPPRDGMYKTNYDGVVFAESEEAGIGVIVRDGKGDVIAALAKKIPYPSLVEVLEALAARRAAKFVVELGLLVSEFEGDSKVVWRALKLADGTHSSIGEIIKDTMSICTIHKQEKPAKAKDSNNNNNQQGCHGKHEVSATTTAGYNQYILGNHRLELHKATTLVNVENKGSQTTSGTLLDTRN